MTPPADEDDRENRADFDGLVADRPSPGELAGRLAAARVASRIFEYDLSVFAPAGDPAVAAAIEDRLGWLSAPEAFGSQVGALSAFADDVARDGLTDVYLLGMGGSSLCAEVLRDVAAEAPPCRLVVLDTTDERTVRQAIDALNPSSSLFLVASKSGSTIEVSALESHFWSTMGEAVGPAAGRHFVAITDPGSPLVALAGERGYRRTFQNHADIGGRYSALSLFGLVPAALLGIDLGRLLDGAAAMADSCRSDAADNPGVLLGAFMASQAAAGRDKMTLLLPPALAPFGVWVEQLVAESTGKQGRGVLPIVGEPLGEASEYGPDRSFVVVLTTDTGDLDASARTLEAAGHPVFRIVTSPASIGREFFRWEFATAVAGAALDINPFDEPNVKAAKERTAAQLETWRATGAFRLDPPFVKHRGYARREHGEPGRGGPGRYLALLDYLPADWRRPTVIERLRGALRRRTGLSTTHGVGPRYLHSTGQYHKGGPNTGIFVMLTSADEGATPVPGTDYSFSTLKHAQALGDFDALVAAGRAVIHYHIDDPSADVSETLERVLRELRS